MVYSRVSFVPEWTFATSRRSALNILQSTGLGEAPLGRPGGEAEVGTEMNSQREERGHSGWVAV